MMDQLVQPCMAATKTIEVITAVGIVLNALLLTFLTNRRVQKDQKDARRWTRSSMDHEETMGAVKEVQRELNGKTRS